ncbi:type II secretion system protein [Alienimonas californiensis]|uniref:Type II secretion system protein G n=1 Tax=Alienimonas californiensis TaxID=2527989 RepID=A0A517P7L7_9PLAN|nr:type II secretion system protein [Alienimonas californiensis]QDT15353.1 hypothetical protein CA12_14380 [Alienimonas californiensis]
MTPLAPPPTSPSRTPRGAFTLIELLVVVSIVAILLSLTVTATLAFVTNAREAATRTTLTKIDAKVQRRIGALRRGLETTSGNVSSAGGGAAGPLRVKMAMLNQMPSYLYPRGPGPDGEIGTADDPLPLSEGDYVTAKLRGNAAVTGPFEDATYRNDATASSEALFLFLSQGETYGVEDTDADAFKESELADADGDGLREIVDGFGNPIRFYRWPTRLIRPAVPGSYNGLVEPAVASTQDADGRWPVRAFDNAGDGEFAAAAAALFGAALPSRELDGSGNEITDDAAASMPFLPTLGSALRADPDDRYAQMNLSFKSATDPRSPFSRVAKGVTTEEELGPIFERFLHTPATFYVPMAVSAGADGELGLYEPQDRANFGHLAQPKEPNATLDNLTTAQGGF